ncbi:MAG: hypothetical protein JO304_17035 [Solirubrobacterales bacterium]|nr:hypothetical protein [Solirubrobacterales bacterium]
MDPKQEVRERIWNVLEREGAARFPGARGRIPNFRGAEQAAGHLADLLEWQAPGVIKSNPDAPQLPLRRCARARAGGRPASSGITSTPRSSRRSRCSEQ